MKIDPILREWRMIAHRGSGKSENPLYKDCKLDEGFQTLDGFKRWREGALFADSKDNRGVSYQIDKDILVPKNRVYGPETCVYVPVAINSFFASFCRRGYKSIGVQRLRDGSYRACVNVEQGGRRISVPCSSAEEANAAYLREKKKEAARWAEYFKDCLDPRVLVILSDLDMEPYMNP